MLCPTCQQPIPDNNLSCPRCAAAKSYQAVLELQKGLIRRIEKGESTLTLTKFHEAQKWHLALLHYPQQAWCGQTLNPRWSKMRLAWPKIDDTKLVCDDCRRVFEEIAENADSDK